MMAGYKIIAAFIVLGCLNFYSGEAPALAEEPLPEVYTLLNIEYKAESLDDPFIDYKAEQNLEGKQRPTELKPLPALSVQGMIWGGNFSQAIINNKIVKIGDTIEGARINEINKDGIEVFYDNQLYKLDSPANKNYGSIKKIQERGGKK